MKEKKIQKDRLTELSLKGKENHRKTDENEMDPVLGTTNQIQFRH